MAGMEPHSAITGHGHGHPSGALERSGRSARSTPPDWIGEPVKPTPLGPAPCRSARRVLLHFVGQPVVAVGAVVWCAGVVVARAFGQRRVREGPHRDSSSRLWMSLRRLRLELRGTDADRRAWTDERVRVAIARVRADQAAAAAKAAARTRAATGSGIPNRLRSRTWRASAGATPVRVGAASVTVPTGDRRGLTAADVNVIARAYGWAVAWDGSARLGYTLDLAGTDLAPSPVPPERPTRE
jgi:hypothetical protein